MYEFRNVTEATIPKRTHQEHQNIKQKFHVGEWRKNDIHRVIQNSHGHRRKISISNLSGTSQATRKFYIRNRLHYRRRLTTMPKTSEIPLERAMSIRAWKNSTNQGRSHLTTPNFKVMQSPGIGKISRQRNQ
jgi:hypothetical protein